MTSGEDPNTFAINERRIEQFIPWFRAFGFLILCVGVVTAHLTGTMYWVERSGKILVAWSLLFTYVQFRYEHHFSERLKSSVDLAEKLTHEKSVPEREARTVIDTAVDQARLRFDDVRRRVLLHALIFAGIGEITAALGGVTLSGIRSLIVD